ncbi:unnamed protein product [Rhizopus stolonifer]
MIIHVIDVLSKIPFSLTTLKKHALGLKLKDIIKKAAIKLDGNVIEKGNLLKKQWMRQDSKEKRSVASANGLSKNKPAVSSQGLIAKTTPNVIRKPIHRLSLDKEPPKKVSKTMEHPQYIIDLIKEQCKHDIKPDSSQRSSNQHPYPITQAVIPLHQPQVIYHVSRTPQAVTAQPQVLTTPPHNTSLHKVAIPLHQSQVTRHILRSPQAIPVPTHIIPPKEKKRVRFASRLSTTREYTPEPDKGKEETANYITIPWYKPCLLELGDIETPQSIDSNEMIMHDKREQTTLCKVYTSAKYIPDSPEEPDELPYHNNDTPIIPNFDTVEIHYVG